MKIRQLRPVQHQPAIKCKAISICGPTADDCPLTVATDLPALGSRELHSFAGAYIGDYLEKPIILQILAQMQNQDQAAAA